MSELETNINRLLAVIDETPGLWQSIDLRVMAGRVDGRWVNLLSVAQIDDRPVRQQERWKGLPSTPVVACFQAILPIGRLRKLLADVHRGTVRVGGKRIAFRKKDATTGKQTASYDWSFVQRSWALARPFNSRGFGVGHYFVARGEISQAVFGQIDDGLEGLNNALRRLSLPWDGVDAIAKNLLRTNLRVDFHGNAAFELFAPIPARMEGAGRIKDGKLKAKVVASARAVPHLSVGYFGTNHDGAVVQDSLALPGIKNWIVEEGGVWHEAELDAGDADKMALFLNAAASN